MRIAIIGDYNFTYNTHHATNLAIDHASQFLEIECNYYWIKINEFVQLKQQQQLEYDAYWIGPGPYKNQFYLLKIIEQLIQFKAPVLLTGESYYQLFETLIQLNNLNKSSEKLISDNLIAGSVFEKVEIVPQSDALKKLYENHSITELSSSRYSLYPKLIEQLSESVIDIEALNQFEDPEIISLKNNNFFLACAFCPQISSTREIPHPLIYTFLKAGLVEMEKKEIRSN